MVDNSSLNPTHNPNIQIFEYKPVLNHCCLAPKELTRENFFEKYIFDPRSADLKPLDQLNAVRITVALFVCTLGLVHLGLYLLQLYNAPMKSDAIVKNFGFTRLKGPAGQREAVPGVSDAALDAIQRTIDKRKIPLQLFPKRPETTYEPNLKNAQAYVAKLPQEDQPAMQKAIDKIQYISMKKFDAALSDCVQELDRQIGQEKYNIGIVCGKSNQWVSSLALKTLKNLPNSWSSLGDSQGTMGLSDVPRMESNYYHAKEKTMVLFDDVGYSGRQMKGNVSRILEQKPGMHLYVVVPFISALAIERLREAGESHKGRVTLITTNERVETMGKMFTPEEEAVMKKYTRYEGDHNLTLAYTDWRYPDSWSFLPGFGSSGSRQPGTKRTIDEDDDGMLKPEQYFLPAPGSIKRPYGIEGVKTF